MNCPWATAKKIFLVEPFNSGGTALGFFRFFRCNWEPRSLEQWAATFLILFYSFSFYFSFRDYTWARRNKILNINTVLKVFIRTVKNLRTSYSCSTPAGVHAIIIISTSNSPEKLQQNSNTCTSPNSHPNNNNYRLFNRKQHLQSQLQYFQLGGVLKKTILGSCDSRREIVFFGLSSNFVSQKYGKYSTFNLGEISNSKATANSSTTNQSIQ